MKFMNNALMNNKLNPYSFGKPTSADIMMLEKWVSGTTRNDMLSEFEKTFNRNKYMEIRGFGITAWFKVSYDWYGIIPLEGRFKHVLLAMMEGQPFVVREFPDYNTCTVPEITSNDKIFPYYEGVRKTLYSYPGGEFWGKTDKMELIERIAVNTVNFQGYLEESPTFNKLHDMVVELHEKHKYAVSISLYGNEMSSFDKSFYKGKHCDYVVTHIEDRNTHKFIPYEEVLTLCEQYGVNVVKECSSIDDEMIKTTGGYMVQRYQDGEIEYFVQKNADVQIDKTKAVVRDIWEKT